MTRAHGGTGIGLAMARRLVDLMSGRISVRSTPGLGSTFELAVDLPRFETGEPVLAPRPELNGLSIVVVDENATHAGVLRAICARTGMKCTWINRDLVGLRVDEAKGATPTFDLAIINSAHRGHLEVLSKLEPHGVSAAATLALLGWGTEREQIVRCRELGIRAWLKKPFSHRLLLQELAGLGADVRHRKAAPSDPEPAAEMRASLRILVADDNPVNQQLARVKLCKLGHEVVLAANGREAVEHFSTRTFDAILMDLQMPVMTGLEAVAEIRRLEQGTGSRIFILAVTAHTLDSDIEDCARAGTDGHVGKPVNWVDLDIRLRSTVAPPSGTARD
jgi:CheY-like chemotaxis protein